ncbi:MAG: hypothetical protein ACE363_02180 [Alphaproteobacteria bacterium]
MSSIPSADLQDIPRSTGGTGQPAKYRAVAAAVLTLLVFQIALNLSYRLHGYPTLIMPAAGLALAGAVLFYRVRYTGFPDIFRVLARATAAGILVYLIVERPDFTLANEDYAYLARYVSWGYWGALAIAAISLFRPSFIFPAGFFIVSTRYVVDEVSGFRLSGLDINYMVEMGQFLAISACLIALARFVDQRLKASTSFRFEEAVDLKLLAQCLAFIAIGFHLGNYFWSGIAKLALGPAPWTWAVENQTQNLVVLAMAKGVLPSGHWPGFTQSLHDGFGSIVSLSNWFVLITQLLAVVAVLRVFWLRAASWAYDALHIGIYVFGGLFFWPWIWNNLSVYLAVRGKTDSEIGWAPKFCCVVAILLGGTGVFGHSAWLAWWDVTDVKINTVQVQAPDETWVDVPLSFFVSHSYGVSHGYLDFAATQGHYAPTRWGSAHDYNRQLTSGQCIEPPALNDVEPADKRERRLDRVGAFLRAHHAKMVERSSDNRWHNFYFRSHHHPSNPLMYNRFNSLPVDQISHYRLVTQSACYDLENGQLRKQVIKEDIVEFPLSE